MRISAAKIPLTTDGDLVERARDGDRHAFGELACRHQRGLYRLALHILGDRTEAEDLTQEAFMRMHGVLDRLDARSEPSACLSRILVNLSLHRIRARRRALRFRPPQKGDPRLDGIADQTPTASASSPGAVEHRLYAALAQAIDDLGETLRVTLVLVCIDGRSHAEAAEILGASEMTIASRVHGAKRELHEALAAYGYDSAAVEILESGDLLPDETSIEGSPEPGPCLPVGMETDLSGVLERWPPVSAERRDWTHFAARVEARIALTKRAKTLESISDEQLLASPLPEVGFKDFAKPAGQAPPPNVAHASRGNVPATTWDDSRVHGSEGPASCDPAPPMVPVSVGLLSEGPAVHVGGSAPAVDRRSSFGGAASLVGVALAAVTFLVVRAGQAPEAVSTRATMPAPSSAVAPAPEATVATVATAAGAPTPAMPAESPGVDPLTLPKVAVAPEPSRAQESHDLVRAMRLGATVDAKDAEDAVAPGNDVATSPRAESSAPAPMDSARPSSVETAASAPSSPPEPTPMTPPSGAPEVLDAGPGTSARPENAANERPSQGEVMGALAEVLRAARDCLNEDDAVSRARVIFGSDGAVQSVTISGFAVGRPSESCIKAALAEARVSSFKDATYGATVTVRP
jgi:RNA polymerase sigma-70 factor (ECF subfamily)